MRQRAYQKIFGLTKIWVKKKSKNFGQNRVSNSRDIDLLTNVAKANVAWTNVTVTVGNCSRYSQGPTFKVLSKSDQLELKFLIWTNVARKNVAWTNVTITVGICSRYSQGPTFKVSS